jgi:hypothetical protein
MMGNMINTSNSSQSYLSDYRQQIDALERAAATSDPAGARAYDEGLERQFEAVKAQLTDAKAGPQQDGCCHEDQSGAASHGAGGHGGSSPSSSGADGSGGSVGSSPSNSGAGTLGTGNIQPALAKYAPMINAASRATGVSPDIIAAQLWQESRGDAGATSTNPGNGMTDVGLMQINPGTYADLQRKHPQLQGKSASDPATNILAASYLMSDLLKQYGGNVDAALRAYNSGSVDLSNPNIAPGGIGDPNYVRSVNEIMSDLKTGQAIPA